MQIEGEDSRILLLAIHSRFARAIMDGNKTVELRRLRPNVKRGDFVVLYETLPRACVTVCARIAAITEDSPAELWLRFGDRTGLGKREFHKYFAGARRGTALQLESPLRSRYPVHLSRIRSADPSFNPPQGFTYLTVANKAHRLIIYAFVVGTG